MKKIMSVLLAVIIATLSLVADNVAMEAQICTVTLGWPVGLTAVSYSVDGEAGSALVVADGTAVISGTNGAPITLTGTLGYATRTVTGNITTNGMLELPAIDIGYYFPLTATIPQDGTAGCPYEIANAAGLKSLAAAVAAGFGADLFYRQTGDIDMSSAGPFPGIGTTFSGTDGGIAFTGEYDGQGHKILDIDFTQRKYGGVFNQVIGGTIKNLIVENITCNTFDVAINGGKWGCAIVGYAGMGATLQRLTADGCFGSAEIPCSHSVAGIVVRVSADNTGTLVKDCVNNAALYGFYSKAAGITALAMDGSGYVLFDGCVNNANIALVQPMGSDVSRIGSDGLAGILGTVMMCETRMRNCVNKGLLASPSSTARVGGLVGWVSGTLVDLGGNVNESNVRMFGDTYGHDGFPGQEIVSFPGAKVELPKVIASSVRVAIVSSKIRDNDPTVMDVTYVFSFRTKSETTPRVKIRALAFEEGERSFARVVRPETFIDGTATNIGDNVAANVEHTLSWKVSSDWAVRLAKVKFEVLACAGELLPLKLRTIPAGDTYGKLEFSWNETMEAQAFNALLWLYADNDTGLTLSNGILRNGSVQLASGTEMSNPNAISYIYSKMGYNLLSGAVLNYVNSETRLGLSPSGARQYAYKIMTE